MEPDPREPTGDLGYDSAHEETGDRTRPEAGTPQTPPVDDGGDHGYDEAHDFRR